MAVDFSGLLNRKYDIMQQNSDAQDRLSWANTGAINQQTQLAPAEAAAKNFATRASGTQVLASGRLADTTSRLAPGIASSEDTLRQGQAGAARAQGNYLNTNAQFAPAQHAMDWMKTIHDISSPNPGTVPGMEDPSSFATGTDMVDGPGTATSDSVPAKLSKGEAVLNAAAAEHLGRSTIDFLNAIGAHKMGLNVGTGGGEAPDKSQPAKGNSKGGPPVNNQTGEPAGYAMGTDNVGGPPSPGQTVSSGTWTPQVPFDPRAATGITGVPRPQTPAKPQAYAKGTSNVRQGTKPKAKSSAGKAGKGDTQGPLPPPGVMQALLAMGGGGGGMPPSGASPMPMSMPQVAQRG